MKFPIRNIFFLFLLFSGSCLTTLAHESNDQETQIEQTIDAATAAKAEPTLSADQYEELLKGVLGHAKRLGSILQSAADQISNKQIKKLKNKNAVLQHIMLLKGQINALEQQAQSLVDQDLNKIATILTVIEVFAKHINTFIQSDFASIPELKKEDFAKRSNGPASVEAVINSYHKNGKMLGKIETDVNKIGLNVFNRAFRWLEKVNDDYKISNRLWKGSLCGLALGTLVLLIDKDILENIPGYGTVIEPFKNLVGPAPRYGITGECANQADLKMPGKFIDNFGKNGLGIASFVFAPFITWQAFGSYMKPDAKKAKDWTDNKVTSILNWLRGGAARKKMNGGKREPSVTFKDGIGFEHIKYALYPYIEYYCRTEGWDRANIAPQTGIIFAGESRTGKTYMAEMLAGQIKQEMKARGVQQELSFIVFNAAEVQMLGIGAILEYARSQAPCIIFIDEIDMLGLQRENNAQVLSEFLTVMSGCMEKDINKRVILIGATNKPESLDKALLQYGRFGKVIWFELPSMHERIQFLVRECQSRAILIKPEFLQKLARETENCSYDALHNIIATAAQKAKMDGSAVKQQHIELAFDEEIRQMLVKNIQLPQHQQQLIALHIAGHTLATHLLDGQKKVSKVTIRPVKTKVEEEPLWARFERKKEKIEPVVYGKVFTFNKDQEFSMPSYEDMINECKTVLAGHAAEKIIHGSTGHSYHRNDHKEALSIAKYIVFKGMDPDELPKKIRYELEEKAYNLMNQCEQEVIELLTQEKERLLMLAEALEKQHTLSGKEVAMLASLTNDEIVQLRKEIKKLEEEMKAEMQETLKEAQNNEQPTEDTTPEPTAA